MTAPRPAATGRTAPGPAGGPDPGPGRPAGARTDPDPAGVGELIGNVSRDLGNLVRQELALARAELRQEMGRARRGAGALAGAVLTGQLAATALSVALGLWLTRVWPPEAAALSVAVLWAALTAVLYVQGTRLLQDVRDRAGGSRHPSDRRAGRAPAQAGRNPA